MLRVWSTPRPHRREGMSTRTYGSPYYSKPISPGWRLVYSPTKKMFCLNCYHTGSYFWFTPREMKKLSTAMDLMSLRGEKPE